MIPEPGYTNLNFADFIILLGIVQGLLLVISYILHGSKKEIYTGLFFLTLTLTITEIFLNRTGYMYKVIWLVDFSEPFQFTLAPLTYLILKQLQPETGNGKPWLHFIPFFAYFIFFIPFYFAPNDYKFESYYFIHHAVNWSSAIDYSFYEKLGMIRQYQLQACVLQITIYSVLNFQFFKFYLQKFKNTSTSANRSEVIWWMWFNLLLLASVGIIIAIKMTFVRDIGDHIIAAAFSVLIYLTTFRELTKAVFQTRRSSPYEPVKYSGSKLSEDKKEQILESLSALMGNDHIYCDNLISLTRVAKRISEPSYIVSQVINEKLNLSFYEWVAFHRINRAKLILKESSRFTIDDIVEQVGYNSKSSFNKAFKKFTGQTPSEFRNS